MSARGVEKMHDEELMSLRVALDKYENVLVDYREQAYPPTDPCDIGVEIVDSWALVTACLLTELAEHTVGGISKAAFSAWLTVFLARLRDGLRISRSADLNRVMRDLARAGEGYGTS